MERSSSGLGRRGQEGMLLVCVGVNVTVCSPERASPHHRSCAHCSVCPETHMQIWHGSANNLHEFVYYGFMSLNLSLSSKKDSCVDEKVHMWFWTKGGCVGLRLLPAPGFTCIHLCICVSICLCMHVHAVWVYVQPMRLSIRGDSFTSWSQIWISLDEILFPLDWSSSPLIPAQELHD